MIVHRHRDRQRWLGSEAHVRRHVGASRWHFRSEWRLPLFMVVACATGAAGMASVCALRGGDAEKGGRAEMREGRRPRYSVGTVVAAFALGGFVGGAIMVLTAPESGAAVRRRLARGAQTAQDELGEIVSETREAVEALTKDARQTIRRTAWRLCDVWDATRAAVKNDPTKDQA